MAKKAKLVENTDRISDLPDSILSQILSFLPTNEAVRTSVLSTKWRNIFTLVSNLDIEFNPRTSYGNGLKSFKYFVDMFLHNHTKVDNIRLICARKVNFNRIRRLVSGAVCREVKHLDLILNHSSKFTLPDVLLTCSCSTLVTLKLDIRFVSNVPIDVCSPNLKTLHLKSKKRLNEVTVKSFISSCISLEDLVLENSTMNKIDISHDLLKRLTILQSSRHCSSVAINTPALVYFKYSDGLAGGYALKNLESVVVADIDLVQIGSNNHQAEVTSFFRGINNVQSLNLSFNSARLLNSCETLPIFLKLVRLKVCHDSYCYYSERGLAKLLMNSDRLEQLAFNQEVFNTLPGEVPFCVMFKLKVIEISRFHSRKTCIGRAKYFLENARALEKLTIRTTPFISEEKKQKISEELLVSPRQAKECCILIV